MMDFAVAPFWGFGGLMMIFLWVILIWGFYTLVKWMGADSMRKEKSALDIAKERYAKGEIDAREFEDMKRNITESSR